MIRSSMLLNSLSRGWMGSVRRTSFNLSQTWQGYFIHVKVSHLRACRNKSNTFDYWSLANHTSFSSRMPSFEIASFPSSTLPTPLCILFVNFLHYILLESCFGLPYHDGYMLRCFHTHPSWLNKPLCLCIWSNIFCRFLMTEPSIALYDIVGSCCLILTFLKFWTSHFLPASITMLS